MTRSRRTVSAKPRPADGLQTLAERTCRQIHGESGVSELQIQSKLVADVGEPASVLVIAEGRGHIGNLRNTFWWFLDPDGNTWHLSVAGTAAVPAETRVGELRAAARTWRALSAPAPRRRWWKVW